MRIAGVGTAFVRVGIRIAGVGTPFVGGKNGSDTSRKGVVHRSVKKKGDGWLGEGAPLVTGSWARGPFSVDSRLTFLVLPGIVIL